MEYSLKNNLIITLRDAVESDGAACIEFMHKVNKESKNLMREPEEFNMSPSEESDFIRGATVSPDACFLVAVDKDLIISTAGFHGNSLKRVNHRVSLGISVLKDYQGLGLGRIVMKALIDRAIELKKTKMDLEVRIDNHNAIHLYESLGFEREGIIKNGFFVDNKYVDLLIMGKLL